MHRTTGSDYTTVGGLPNQHIDQSLPGTPGTKISGEFLNALQEEIKAILDEAGITIETNPATDRSNGFHQMKDAVFDSAAIDTAAIKDDAITSAKIASCSLDNLTSGDLSYTSGDYIIFIDEEEAKWSKTTGGFNPIHRTRIVSGSGVEIRNTTVTSSVYTQLELDHDRVKISDVNNATYDEYYTDMIINQIHQRRYNDDDTYLYNLYIAPTSGFQSVIAGSTPTDSYGSYRFDGIEFQGSNLRIKHTVISVPDTGWIGSDPYYTTVETGIPDTAKILLAQFSITVVSSGNVYFVDTGSIDTDELYFIPSGGTFGAFIEVSNYNPGSATYTDRYVTIIYSDPSV